MRAVRRVPRGRVTSYAAIAALIGNPRAARAVGSALRALPDDVEIPWWRVVNGRGTISPGGNLHRDHLQRALLETEQVHFDGAGRIDLARFGWRLPREVD
jgi:methylated-DNA-protein-cysteine methyltransferase-like protein